MGRRMFRLFATFGVALLATGVAFSQTDVVANGSFESGLTGWTVAPSTTGNDPATLCSFNASTGAGTETASGTASLPPSAGTQLAMGSAKNTTVGGVNSSCVLYQDVAIPAGAKSATLTVKWGIKYIGLPSSNAALLAKLYSSTATVPYYTDAGAGAVVGTAGVFYEPAASDTVLGSGSSGSFNVTSLAGTTARLALFIAITPGAGAARYGVGGFDEVHLLVTAPATISKVFGAASVPFNGSTSLTFTINQPTVATTQLTSAAFTDTLPAGLVVASPSGQTGSCGGGTITAVAGSSSVSLSGGVVDAGTSCTFSVNVTGTTAGVKNNSVTLASSNGGNTSTASLTVLAAPTVTSVSPSSGPTAGGTSVTINGTNLTGATSVTFGGTAATSFTVNTAIRITATTPASAAGSASVIVTTPGGSNAANTLYTYIPGPTVTAVSPSSGPTAGGTSVTITGTTFTGATSVTFGGSINNSGKGEWEGLNIYELDGETRIFVLTKDPPVAKQGGNEGKAK